MGTMRDTKRHEFTNGSEAHAKAKHMAQYSRRDWLAWTSRDETRHFAQILTADSLKAALLENGTQRRFAWGHHASTGGSYLVSWRLGLIMLHNFKNGYEPKSQGGRA